MKKNLTWLFFASFFLYQPLMAQFNYWISDPSQRGPTPVAGIDEAFFTLEPKGAYTELGIYLVFSAGESEYLFEPNASLELIYEFSLPEEAMVTDSWLWVEDEIIRAKILDRWLASTIYEGIVNRRQDPSLLIKESATQYRLQVYPLPNGFSRKVKITAMVPNEWTETDVFTAIMPEFIAYAPVVPDLRLEVIVPSAGPLPQLISHPSITFLKTGVSGEKDVYGAQLPASLLKERKPVVVRTTPRWQSGIYLSTYGEQTDGFYELGILPSAFLGNSNERAGTRVMLLLQYKNNGPIDLPYEEFLGEIRQAMEKNLGDGDEFNVVTAGLSPNLLFDDWVPVTEQNIAEAFDRLRTGTISSNYLPGLIGEGIAAVKKSQKDGIVVLFANSTDEGEPEYANDLLADIARLTEGEDAVPCFVADYTYPANYPRYFVEPNLFFGNAYFYTNLTRQTGGDWLDPDCCSRSFSSLCDEIFSLALDERVVMDIYSTLDSGFTYNRFNLGDERGGSFNIRKPIFQFGKYKGNPPFSIELAAFSEDQLYFNTFSPTIIQGDSSVANTWYGFRIRELESRTDNQSITELINLSLEYRILSLYTAFLCLEPSLGGEPCPTCADRSNEGGIVGTTEAGQDTLVRATFAPNPFSESVAINLELGEGINFDNYRMSIYDLAGREVFVFRDLPVGKIQSIQFTWDGRSATGEKLPGGMYFLHLKGEGINSSFALLKQ